MKNWLQKKLLGRAGVDQLSSALLFLSLILLLIALPLDSLLLRLSALILMGICYYRIFSKHLLKRQQENLKFMSFYTLLEKKCHIKICQLRDIKHYKYFHCPNCHQTLRVPRGKGKVIITCPKCHKDFHKHS